MSAWDWAGTVGGMLGLLSAGFLLGLAFGVRVAGRSALQAVSRAVREAEATLR